MALRVGNGSVRQVVGLVAGVATILALVSVGTAPAATAAGATVGPLHTTGTDSVIYDSANQPVRLVGFNWSGTDLGGRSDYQKTADVCGVTWRTTADSLSGLTINYDNMYQTIKGLGYNVIRLPISWNNLEPVAPVWDAGAGAYVHTWNQAYLNDLKSMVTKARAAGLMVILDMHQDYWSPALHHITNWDGSPGYCEGVGMPRWLDPTADGKATTTQNTDFYNSMNWFYRNIQDPLSTTTQVTPWQLLYAAWDELATQFSPANFADSIAVVGADLLNEPYWSYVGGSPPAGQTVLQAAGTRLQAFYDWIAPAVTTHNPSWLLFFQDCTGGYNAANPSLREAPVMTGRPNAPGNWVYSYHAYNFKSGTFSDGVVRDDDFGITVANAMLANAKAWKVPLYVGEFTNFTMGIDARNLTTATIAQTQAFVAWAKQNQVSWTFWAYMNPYWPMAFIDYTTGLPIPVVRDALGTGLDGNPNPPPVSPELLPDPGFEAGNGGWTPFIVGNLSRVANPTHTGSFALQVAATAATVNYVGLTQNSVVTNSVAGTTYTASCWVQPTRGTLNVQFRFLEYAKDWASYIPRSTTTANNLPAGTWTQVTVSSTAVNSGDRMIPQIYATNQTTNTGNLLYDDCSVRAGTPPPPPPPPPATPPTAPQSVTATGANQSAVVTFSPPANNGGAAVTSYTVTSSPDGVTASGATSPITVAGLRNGTAYTFTVTATNNAGTGPPSTASNAVTPNPPPVSPELLPDPGFEAGNGGWTPFIVGNLSRVANPTHTGSFALQVAATAATVNYVGLTQNSVVTNSVAGTTYTASCWVQPTRGTLNVQFRFLEYAKNWASYIPRSTTTANNLPAGTWTQVTVSSTAVNSGDRMIPQIYATNQTTNTGNLLYDDCSVRATP